MASSGPGGDGRHRRNGLDAIAGVVGHWPVVDREAAVKAKGAKAEGYR
jgi:hypothetical protein